MLGATIKTINISISMTSISTFCSISGSLPSVNEISLPGYSAV
jgi:hypothetical protein